MALVPSRALTPVSLAEASTVSTSAWCVEWVGGLPCMGVVVGARMCGYRGLSVPYPAVCAVAAVSGRTVW